MNTVVLYVHGRNGSADEAEHYRPLFKDCDVVGLDYRSETPWDCVGEFGRAFDALRRRYDRVWLVANSIGAFFSMTALSGKDIARAWFISPIVDMERLIMDMLRWAGASEARLRAEGTIETPFGETLSHDYLQWVRAHPIRWTVPTSILYGDGDQLTSGETIAAFAEAHRASLTVMRGGEHWFHTEAQMQFLDEWIAGTV